MTGDQSAQRGPATRVLYIAGAGRSGSTLVANLLGSAPGMISVGELRYLWERGLGEAALCGCGNAVPDCPFWKAVLARAYGTDKPDIDRMLRTDRELLRLRSLPSLIRSHGDARALGTGAQWYVDELAKTYRAIAAESGAVIVDSSKLIGYGYLLSRIDEVDLRTLHLVRDPRGVAHSWSQNRDRNDRGSGEQRMGRERLTTSAVLWNVHNATSARLLGADSQRYVRVRYEDFVADPRAALAPVMQMLGFELKTLPVSDDGVIRLTSSHTVAGNPNRMSSGPTRVTPDVAWQSTMPAPSQLLVSAVCAPLLHRFGYSIARDRRAPTSDASDGAQPPRVFVEDMNGPQRFFAVARRNVRWIGEQGLARALEEKEIDPLRTVPAALGKRRYRRRGTSPAGNAVPVFLVGLQRSGTNMVVRGLGMAPEVEVHSENDNEAFDRYKLRPAGVIERIVASSRHSHVLFKPLCDSHRIDQILDDLHTLSPGRAVWAYRDVDARVRSAVAKFGDGNLQVLREFADGTNTTRWHVQRISPESAELIRSFDYDKLSAESGAALMWLIRNRLYFELGLDERADVYLTSYEEVLRAPSDSMQGLCEFLGFPYRDSLVRHIAGRPPTYKEPLEIDPRIRALCDDLADRLDKVLTQLRHEDVFRIANDN